LRSRQSLSCSRICQHFIESERSLLWHKRSPLVPILSQKKSVIPPVFPLRSILITFSHLCRVFLGGIYSSGFTTKILYSFFFSPLYFTCPSYFILLDLIILITFGEEYKLRNSSLCSFLQPPVTSSLFRPNILLSTIFSNTYHLCSSPNVRNQVSHTYSTAVL
jgi:hypothetical protein